MNRDYNVNCLQINTACVYLADEFGKKYYGDFQLQRVDRRDSELHYNLEINQDFRNIDEIYTALWYDIPKKIVFDYKEKSLAAASVGETFMNLKNFYFDKIGQDEGYGK